MFSDITLWVYKPSVIFLFEIHNMRTPTTEVTDHVVSPGVQIHFLNSQGERPCPVRIRQVAKTESWAPLRYTKLTYILIKVFSQINLLVVFHLHPLVSSIGSQLMIMVIYLIIIKEKCKDCEEKVCIQLSKRTTKISIIYSFDTY